MPVVWIVMLLLVLSNLVALAVGVSENRKRPTTHPKRRQTRG